jgi:hypothetical protein
MRRQLMLAFRNTRGGVKDVSLRRPGYDATQTFTTAFVQALQPFGVVRLMDFLRTNSNPVRDWSQRTTPGSATQASPKGGSSNTRSFWPTSSARTSGSTFRWGRTIAYVLRLAQLLKRSLAPERTVYVEYSNELWNFQFPQSEANMKAAVRRSHRRRQDAHQRPGLHASDVRRRHHRGLQPVLGGLSPRGQARDAHCPDVLQCLRRGRDEQPRAGGVRHAVRQSRHRGTGAEEHRHLPRQALRAALRRRDRTLLLPLRTWPPRHRRHRTRSCKACRTR